MATTENVTAVYARIENQPGSLERLARVFQERRANIDAISADTVGSTGVVRILAKQPREVVQALRSAGIDSYESETLVTTLPNKAGELFRLAGDLAASGINIESVMTTADGRLALRTSDNERTAQILKKR